MKISVAVEIMNKVNKDIEIVGHPVCFESEEQYAFWLKNEREAQTLPVKRFICEDCTACYQKVMKSEGKCVNDQFDVSEVA